MFRRSFMMRQAHEFDHPVQPVKPVSVGEDAMLAIKISAEIESEAKGLRTR
jgi:hypothetical protein